MTELFANLAQTTLASGISAGATSLSVASTAGFPATGSFRIIIDAEIFLVTNVSGTTFTVTPGSEGSTQSPHAGGTPVAHVLTAQVMQRMSYVLGGTAILNGLGDSITGQGTYCPQAGTTAPAWAASTPYVTGQQVTNGGRLYRCTSGGTSASSGGPSGTGSGIADGTAAWNFILWSSFKPNTSFLNWAEIWSNARLFWDQASGYSGANGGFVKGFVVSGGANYTAPTLTLNNGATGTLSVNGGVITGVTLTNPGYPNGAISYGISDASGSGAVLSFAANPSGTFATTGNRTADMVAMLPDAVASNADIFTVHGGTNDIAAITTSAGAVTMVATITGNLRICYETLMNAGKPVIAVPILPKNSINCFQLQALLSVNRWIRAYSRKELWANPLGYGAIALADATGYWTDGTKGFTSAAVAGNTPVGGAGNVQFSMTQDGLHPCARGAMYVGWVVWQAARRFLSPEPDYAPRAYTMSDGYDLVNNIGGNILEAPPWVASTPYALNQRCSNSGKVYYCSQAGTTAPSGGPTTTGSSITDGSAKWNYICAAGISVLASGTTALASPPGGISYSGSIATGTTLSRTTGSASGTVTGAIETPWSNGQNGQRLSLIYSLGSGTNAEHWTLFFMNITTANLGITSSDLGMPFTAEIEVELSSVALMNYCYAEFKDANSGMDTKTSSGNDGTGLTLWASSGEMLSYPRSGRMLLKTQPFIPTTNTSQFNLSLSMGFDASGGAGSATATVKVNYVSVRKAYVA